MARELTTLGDALRAALARLPAGTELASFPIWTEWADVVGPTIARHARPRRLRRGVLVVEVDGAEWMHELQYLKRELRDAAERAPRPRRGPRRSSSCSPAASDARERARPSARGREWVCVTPSTHGGSDLISPRSSPRELDARARRIVLAPAEKTPRRRARPAARRRRRASTCSSRAAPPRCRTTRARSRFPAARRDARRRRRRGHGAARGRRGDRAAPGRRRLLGALDDIETVRLALRHHAGRRRGAASLRWTPVPARGRHDLHRARRRRCSRPTPSARSSGTSTAARSRSGSSRSPGR